MSDFFQRIGATSTSLSRVDFASVMNDDFCSGQVDEATAKDNRGGKLENR